MRHLRVVSAFPFLLLFPFSLPAAELAPRPANPPEIAPASDEAEIAIRSFKAPPGFRIELFAAEPLMAHPVAFAVDEQNRFFVAESFRVGEQVTDIRRNMNWLDEELASTNTFQWRKIIEKYLGDRLDFMQAESERLNMLEDTSGDGRADKSTIVADGFNDLQSGIAAGVLARKGDLYFACIPDLWRLRDTTGDGKADLREVLHHGYGVRFGYYGHDLHGLRIGPDGKLYFSIGDRGFNVLTPEGNRVAAPETGAVFRCNLDGSELEIFASGLRNPQELAFDEFGNLFTGENNSDGGDQARWVYLVEGGDSGWHIGWQFLNWPVSRGPWNAEKMWRPQTEEQPAFLVPPLANFADGPSGVTYNPGTGLPAEYDRHFLMADFKGSPARSLVFSFALEPKGASFEVVNLKPFVSGILATDVEFGMDGAVYISDWVEGWGKTGKGRIYRIYHPESRSHPLVSQTREIVAKGFENRSGKELVELLAWPDQRVRQEAQFELAARGNDSIPLFSQVASSSAHQLARLHAIWGLGQIHSELRKQEQGAADAAIEPVAALLEDADAEVRAQSARVLGDARHSSAVNSLGRLATDTNAPRVQFFAAMALGKIGDEQGAQPILEMLRLNADKDAYLRHAGVMALYHLKNADLLKTAVQDQSPAVRMAALLVYRRQASPGISVFLRDLDPRLVLESARAIYDLPIAEAMPQLASLIHEPVDSEPLLRRVVNANFRLGTANSASALAAFAADSAKLNSARIEALLSLEDWEKPKGRDRITGLWRPLAVRPAETAADELRPILPQLLRDSSDEIQVVAARLAGKHEIREATAALVALAQSEQANSAARSEALRSLAVLNHPELPDLLEKAGLSEDEQLRQETIALWARLDPRAGAERLVNRLESGTVREQQAALLALAGLEAPGVNQVFLDWLDKLLSGQLDPALHLELLEAAYSRKSPALEEKLEQFEQSRPEDETGAYIETLFGGNALHGRTLFFESAEASCVRCHQIDGIGGEAGPALDQPNLSRSREHLLESLVAPNRNITPGFETVILRLADGAVYTGIVQSETETNLVLISPEDGPITLVKSEIESRERGGSGMPEGLGEILPKRDLRDLIEFLARLE